VRSNHWGLVLSSSGRCRPSRDRSSSAGAPRRVS